MALKPRMVEAKGLPSSTGKSFRKHSKLLAMPAFCGACKGDVSPLTLWI
jgi:hypothetical protein